MTVTNTGNQTVTVTLPSLTGYTVSSGTGFEGNTAEIDAGGTAVFTVQPQTGLEAGSYIGTLKITGTGGAEAEVALSFVVTEASHVHDYGTEWKYDETSHWRECSCGLEFQEAAHTLNDKGACTVCDYAKALHMLTVDSGYGAQRRTQHAESTTVSINAGTRTDYRFTRWTASVEVGFADASAAATTFVMPASDVTVTATWEYTGTGEEPGQPDQPGEQGYKVTVSGANAQVYAQGVAGTSFDVESMGSQTLLIRLENGYRVTKVTVNGVDVTDKVIGGYYNSGKCFRRYDSRCGVGKDNSGV